jgi:CelD/BcsL family acetyltransferase involved in cellulose biosynthesis
MDPEDIAHYLRQFRQIQLDVFQQAQRLLNDVNVDAALRTVRRTAQTVGPMLEAAAKSSAIFLEEFSAAVPPNWQRLTNPQIFDAVELMARTGWSLVWTPPSESVVAILEAPDADARRSLLLSAELLGDITAPS